MAAKDVTIGLALSGGSAWGVAHVGALAALIKHGIPVHCIAGTSAGSVVAAPFAFGIPIATIEEAAKKLEWKQIARFAYSRLGVRSNASLATIIKDLVGDADIKEAKIPLAIVATDIEHARKTVFRAGNVAQIVRASCAIPGYFAPVEIDGVLYVDGGITENLPLSPLREMGAQFIIGVDLAGVLEDVRPGNLGGVLARSLDILFHERNRHASSLADIIIKPDVAGFPARSFDAADEIYREGFRATEEAIPLIKTKLALARAERSTLWHRVSGFFNAPLW